MISYCHTFKKLAGLLTAIFVLSPTLGLQATHIIGGELTYEWRTVGNVKEYRFTLVLYGDPDGVPLPGSAIIRREGGSSYNASLLDSARIYTTCSDTVLVRRYRTNFQNILISPNTTAKFYFDLCCRPLSITNLASSSDDGFFISATLNTGASQPPEGSSPAFLSQSNITIQANTTSEIAFTADDADGDSLYYSLVPAKERIGTSQQNVIYASNHSYLHPFDSSTAVFIDQNSGILSVENPSAGDYAVAVEVQAYRNGQLIETVVRDIRIRVSPLPVNTYKPTLAAGALASPHLSTVTTTDSTHFIKTTEGALLKIPVSGSAVYASGAGAPQLLLNANTSGEKDSAITAGCQGDVCYSLTGNISNTTNVSGLLSVYSSYGYVDAALGKRYKTILVENKAFDWCGGEAVRYAVYIIEFRKSSIYAVPESEEICENGYASVAIQGQASNVIWRPSVGVSDTTIFNPLISPPTNTIYTVSSLLDSSIATVFVEVFPDTNKVRLSVNSGVIEQNSSLGNLSSNWFYNGFLIANNQTDFIATNGLYSIIPPQSFVCPPKPDSLEYNDKKQSALFSGIFDSNQVALDVRRIVFEIEGMQQNNIIEHIYYMGNNTGFNAGWDYNIKDMNNNMQTVAFGNQFYDDVRKRTSIDTANLALPINDSSRYQITLFNLGGNMGFHTTYKKTTLPFIDSKGIFKVTRTELERTDGSKVYDLHLPLVIAFASEVDEVIGVEEVELKTAVKVYPNPTKDVLNVEISEGGTFDLTILDIVGHVIMQQKVEQIGQINISNYPPGMYLYQLEKDQEEIIGMFIKQ